MKLLSRLTEQKETPNLAVGDRIEVVRASKRVYWECYTYSSHKQLLHMLSALAQLVEPHSQIL
jgi:diphthamide biosynthesis methyltransferase